MELLYSPRLRTERLIIACRAVLALFSLMAVSLDPFGAEPFAAQSQTVAVSYLVYSLLVAQWLTASPLQVEKLGLLSQIADVLFFTAMVFLTGGLASPFFSYFVFVLFCGALRWQKQGILWTVLILLVLFAGMGISSDLVLKSHDLGLNRFIIRSVLLAIIALLLIYLMAYENRMRKELGKLADWPAKINTSQPPQSFISHLLSNASSILGAPRAIMIWQEHKNPVRQIAYLNENGLNWRQLPPGCFDPPVSPEFGNSHFLCNNAGQAGTRVLQSTPTVLEYRSCLPLNAELTQSYAIQRVIGLALSGQAFQGWLLFLDKPKMIADDLTLGILVSRQVGLLMDQFTAHLNMQKEAVIEERGRMARDLHDGLLQTLTGIALQIETTRRLLDQDSTSACKQLGRLQKVIAEEQRELRLFIQKLKPIPTHFEKSSEILLQQRLAHMFETIEQQWGLAIVFSISCSNWPLPERLSEEIDKLLRESLVNCARHARASRAEVALIATPERIDIIVSDDGRGFSFQGRHDLGSLIRLQSGPKSLMERIAALEGNLVIYSSSAGSRLEISLPIDSSWNIAA